MLGNGNELGSFLKGTKNQVGEDKHKTMPFAFQLVLLKKAFLISLEHVNHSNFKFPMC